MPVWLEVVTSDTENKPLIVEVFFITAFFINIYNSHSSGFLTTSCFIGAVFTVSYTVTLACSRHACAVGADEGVLLCTNVTTLFVLTVAAVWITIALP